ncbi:hypothetical protein A3B46_03465 [Candidatus Roizmanbacteria bacterium RIFCSPLOWO2_01_FULL_39_19]|nr:MAG: hypothetical protein A3B46_03465 [Candidatus Roizmanbacteria bacterium RIFCSPLOWO2_01_FULL_39_19]
MGKVYLLDPTKKDSLSAFRGGGRVIQLIADYLPEIEFINDPQLIPSDGTLIVPYWFPFHPPQIIKTKANKKVLIIFDVIPLKYPEHFPIGLKGMIFKWINTQIAKSYDKIITISQSSKKDIKKYLHIDESKISVCYLTIPKTLLKERESKPNIDVPKTFCLYVGDVNWNKNLPTIAKAIKENKVPCVFAGGKFSKESVNSPELKHLWQESFAEFVSLAKDDPRFIFQERVTDSELKWLYKNALCNILVSHDEGFGLSYLEAATFSTPSILSDIPVFHEIAGDAAIFVNPNDPIRLTQEIDALSKNPDKRNLLGEKANARSKQLSPNNFARQFRSALGL